MKKVIQSLVVGLSLLLMPACSWFGSAPSDSQKNGAAPRVRLVNVLEKEYFDDAHIKGADDVASLNVPWVSLEDFNKATASWEKNIPVVTYCANYMCSASHDAAKALTDAGFEQVFVYSGGTAEWSQLNKKDASYLLAGPAQQGYLSKESKKKGHAAENVKEITAEKLQEMIK